MLEGSIGRIAVPGCINNDHKTYRHPTEDVKSQETLRRLIHKQKLLPNIINNIDAGSPINSRHFWYDDGYLNNFVVVPVSKPLHYGFIPLVQAKHIETIRH